MADYFLTDEATLSQLIGSLATDVVKVGIATGAAIAAATVMAGFTIAIGPIFAVVVIGIGVSWALTLIDEHYGITDKVIQGLDDLGNGAQSYAEKIKQNIQSSLGDAAETIIDYAVDTARSVAINLAKHQLERFLSSRPKVY